MARARTPYTLTSTNISQKANEVVLILRKYNKANPCPMAVLQEETGLTKGQISTVIKYMRRCSSDNLDRFIPYYPISSKKGYFLPSCSQDFIDCYITLALWTCSLVKTIAPMEAKMARDGIDWHDYLPEERQYDINYLDEIPEVNKDTAWFMD